MILSVEHGTFSYGREGRDILRDVNFDLRSGEILAVLGPNGAGKTTLLRCIMGFLKWKSGESCLDGVPLGKIPARRLWQSIAYVPQARGKASASTVENMILLGRSSRIGTLSQPGEADFEAVDRVMRRLDIERLRGRRCDEISGGELQMALIARALAAEPGCVIFDEPESNLDFKNQLIVLETMEGLRDEGIACLFNTHYPDHALRCADKALLISRSSAPVYGAASRVITEDNIGAAFGVDSVIGRIETPGHDYKSITPVAVRTSEGVPELAHEGESCLASINIIVGENADVQKLNEVLHAFSEYMLGRWGLPCPQKGLRVMSVVMDAPPSQIERLTMRLNPMKDIAVKTTCMQQKGVQAK